MSETISLSSQMSAAVRDLALGNGGYRARLHRALAEALRPAEHDDTRPISDALLRRTGAFFAGIRPVDQLTDEEAERLGAELLGLADALQQEHCLAELEHSRERNRAN